MITVQTSLTMTRMSPTRDDSHVIEVDVFFLSLCPSLTHFPLAAVRSALKRAFVFFQGYTVKLLSTKSGEVLVTRGESLEPARI